MQTLVRSLCMCAMLVSVIVGSSQAQSTFAQDGKTDKQATATQAPEQAVTIDDSLAKVFVGLKKQDFDPNKWKKPQAVAHAIGAAPPRAAMLTSFLQYYNVIGMDKGTAHALLGSPDCDSTARVGCTAQTETYQLTSPWSGLSSRYYFDLNYAQGKVKSYRLRMASARSNKVRISHAVETNRMRWL